MSKKVVNNAHAKRRKHDAKANAKPKDVAAKAINRLSGDKSSCDQVEKLRRENARLKRLLKSARVEIFILRSPLTRRILALNNNHLRLVK